MKRLFSFIFFLLVHNSFCQNFRQLDSSSIQLINDIIISKDISYDKRSDSLAKEILGTAYTLPDTAITTKFRLKLADLYIVKTDTLYLYNIPYSVKPAPSSPTQEFNQNDLNYISSQLKINGKIEWDNRIKATIVKSKTTQRLLEISTPLFNYAANKAIISINYNCGKMCGYGGQFLCEKIDGKWRIVRSYGSTWIY